MKPIHLCGLVMALSLGCMNARASHVMGADLTLTCLNTCTMRVDGRVYYDCADPSPAYTNVTTWTPALPGCTPPPAIGPASVATITDITPTCPTIASWCAAPLSSAYGVGQIHWWRDYDICAVAPCIFTVSWTDCCRPNFINNIQNPGAAGYSISTTVNTQLPSCNSSPEFVDPPVTWICNDRDQYIYQGANDPDGDSLSYELGPCTGPIGNQVTYLPGCFPSGPYGPNWSVTVNSASGLVFFDAHPGGPLNAIVCIYIHEWRNGSLIGTTVRDMLVMAQACAGNASPAWGAASNLSSGLTVSGNHLYVCASGNFCFDIAPTDPDAAQGLRIWWDGGLPGATFTEAGNANVQDSISGTTAVPPVGRFCWIPPGNGLYPLRLHVEDDFCPLNGREDLVLWIHVNAVAPTVVVTQGPCPQVQFALAGCLGSGQTYSWSGGDGLGSSAQSFTHGYSSVGTYPWQVIVTGGNQIDTLTGSVVVNGGPFPQALITGNLDLDACAGRLSDTLVATGGFSSYVWNNGATTPSIITGNLPGTYIVEAHDAAGCGYIDTAQVDWIQPDISGRVTTGSSVPLVNQEIYLIRHDTMLQALIAVDSILTDADGNYFFCQVTDTLVFIKAAPDSNAYPLEMPTYADTTLFWNNALTFYPLTQLPLVHDFATLPGVNPGGPGFIGGLITQGANKTDAVGDPVVGLRVFLRDRNSGAVLGYRDTDVNGYFSFAGIPLSDYEILPDKPWVSTTNVPSIALTAQVPALDSLDFRLHSTYLELVMPPNGIPPVHAAFSVLISPNPFGDQATLELNLEAASAVSIQVYDLLGRRAGLVFSGELAEGPHRIAFGDELSSGVYIVQVQADGAKRVLRIVKD